MERSANENPSPSSSPQDERGLEAIDRQQISKLSDHELAVFVAPMLVEAGVTSKYWLETRWEYLRSVVGLLKDRANRLSDFVTQGDYFFFFERNYDSRAEAELFVQESADLLAKLALKLANLEQFTRETTSQVLDDLAREAGVEEERVVVVTRLAVAGKTDGPSLCNLLVVLSQPIVVERIKKAVDYIRAKHKL